MSPLESEPPSPPPPGPSSHPGDPFLFLKRWPWEKILIWALFVGLLVVLRDFFPIIFMTFIVTYVIGNVVGSLFRRMGWKRDERRGLYRGVVLFLILLLVGLLGGFGRLLFPMLHAQASSLVARWATLSPEERLEGTLRSELGQERFAALERSAPYRDLVVAIGEGKHGEAAIRGALAAGLGSAEAGALLDRPALRNLLDALAAAPGSPTLEARIAELLGKLLGDDAFRRLQATDSYRDTMTNLRHGAIEKIPQLLGHLTAFVNQTLLLALQLFISLVFSLVILFDLPGLQEKIRRLGEGRLAGPYREIAPSLVGFGSVLGRSLQAQLVIALANTTLTIVGLFLLDIESPLFLGIVVFVCSFIPVVGALLSSVPITLVALQQEGGGLGLALWAVAMIGAVHALEAYVLNPKILGNILHIHPLLVLVILLVAEHFFGIWGLLLGVPMSYYVYTAFIEEPKGAQPASEGASHA
jgi:predicted PurR-regulated permease PerM